MNPRLDKFDLAILRELQADGRLSNAELVTRVGLSAAPCWRRVRALEEAGIITGYRAILDRQKIVSPLPDQDSGQAQAQRQGRPHGLGIEPLSFDLTHLAHISGQCGQRGLIAQHQPQVGPSPQQ